METEPIIKLIMVLTVVLGILVFILVLRHNKKIKEKLSISEVKIKEIKDDSPINTDLDFLLNILKDKDSSTDTLAHTLDLIIKHHGKIEKKLGIKLHTDFDMYEQIIYTLCKHPHTNKNLILSFDKELGKLNPEYKQEIGDAIVKGLNSRRV